MLLNVTMTWYGIRGQGIYDLFLSFQMGSDPTHRPCPLDNGHPVVVRPTTPPPRPPPQQSAMERALIRWAASGYRDEEARQQIFPRSNHSLAEGMAGIGRR